MRVLFLIFLLYPFFTISGQHPDVQHEPFHQPVDSFGGFRYLHVTARPGDTTALHFHRNPICYLTISGTKVWLDEGDGNQRTVLLPTGWIGSDYYESTNPLLHRFAVVGENSLNLIGIEKVYYTEYKPPPDLNPIFNEDGFVIFDLDWEAFDKINQPYPAVIVSGVLGYKNGSVKGSGALIYSTDSVVNVSNDFRCLLVLPGTELRR